MGLLLSESDWCGKWGSCCEGPASGHFPGKEGPSQKEGLTEDWVWGGGKGLLLFPLRSNVIYIVNPTMSSPFSRG